MERKVRVRFAPSPTGPLHIGGVRTALYNYLFARQMGGDMILRIEDTDSNRFVPGAEDYINEALAWIGIKFDEGVREGGNFGPYKQSERRDIYRRYVKQLIDSGKAYMAFDTPAELEAARNEHKNFQYDASTRLKMRNSLSLPADEVEQLIAEGHPYVVRFLIEPGRDVKVDDLIRGEVTINSSILDDKVLYKSADDLPTYHLANIVDEAFGWADTMPHFVHLPLLLKPDGKGKLSKRDGDRLGFPVFLLEWKDPVTGAISAGYREQGYLPEAVVNFLALLGWNPGDDTEIMSMDELIAKFAFDHCSRSGAKFAFEKGKWFNHEYLMNTPGEKLAALAAPYMAADGINPADFSEEYTAAALDMLKSRATLLTDLWAQSRFFFAAPDTYAEKDIRKRWKPETPRQMAELIEVLESLPDFSAAAAEPVVLQWIADKGYHLGNVMNAFRLAVVGECKGPHMFDITALMGRQETVRRIEKAIDNIKAPEA